MISRRSPVPVIAFLLVLASATVCRTRAEDPVEAPKQEAASEEKDPNRREAERLVSGKTRWPEDEDRAQEKAEGLVFQMIPDDPAAAGGLWSAYLEHLLGDVAAAHPVEQRKVAAVQSNLVEGLAETKVTFPKLVAFLEKIDRSAAAANLGTWESSLANHFSERYAAFPQVMPEEPEQHIFQTRCLRELVRFFQANAKDTPQQARPALAAYALFQFFHDYGYQEYWNDRTSAIEWADKELKPLHPLLSDVMVIAILISDHGRLNAAQSTELRQRIISFASSKEIDIVAKVSALSQAIEPSTHPKLDRPEVAAAVVSALAEYITPQRPLRDTKLLRLLTEISEYRSLSKEDATLLGQKLADSQLRTDRAGQDAVLVGRLKLNLALRSGDPQAAAAALTEAQSALHGHMEVALKLWQAGQGKAAAQLIPGPGEYLVNAGNYFLDGIPQYFLPPLFTREMETHLGEWMQDIADPGQRFRTECVIASRGDATGADAPQENRETRLGRLIDRFAAEASQERAARIETLCALSLSTNRGIELREEMDKLAGETTMGDLMKGRSRKDEAMEMETLIRRGMRYRLETTGDATYFLKQVRSISAVGRGEYRGWDVRQDLQNWFSYYGALFVRRISEVPAEQVPAMLEIARQISESFLSCESRYAQQSGVGFAIMAHAAGNAGAELDDWHDHKLNEHQKEAYDYARRGYGLPNNLRIVRAYPLSNPAVLAQKREVLRRFLCDAATVKREFGTPSEISYIMDFELYNKDDLWAALDAMPKDNPMRAKFFAEKAKQTGTRFHDPDGALKAFDEAVAIAKGSGNVRDLPYVLAVKGRFLDKDLKRPDDALAIAKEIDASLLEYDGQKEWLSGFLAEHKK